MSHSSGLAVPKSQLLMRRSLAEPLPPPEPLPQGYRVRCLAPGEEGMLAQVLADAFPEVGWTVKKTCDDLVNAPDVEAVYVIDYNGRPIATTSVRYLPHRFPDEGVVHWVAVAGAHRGRGLARHLVRRVCLHFIDDGYEASVLETDDFRLPAIRTYLRVGFAPLIRDQTHIARWEAVMQALRDTNTLQRSESIE